MTLPQEHTKAETCPEHAMVTVTGLATSRGLVSGPVFLYRGDVGIATPERQVPESEVAAEVARYRAARVATRAQLQEIIERLNRDDNVKEAEIFSNHLLLFDDPMVISSVEHLITSEHLNAESAVRRGVGRFRAMFLKMNDPYLRERARDIDDLEQRTLQNLSGKNLGAFSTITQPVIVVADDLTPSETVAFPRELILGFATDRGSTTSHVALLSRAFGIPAVVGLRDISSRVKAGDSILLDGTNGAVTIRPDSPTRAAFARMTRREHELRASLASDHDVFGALKDGTHIRLCANVQPGVPFVSLPLFGAQGIGLYRSEYLWLGADNEPSEEIQYAAYLEAVKAGTALGDGARTVIRVLDIGGDKLIHGTRPTEVNPFLGNRSIRYLLSHRDVLRTQLRAVLRASAAGPTAVLYPMVATRTELREVNAELRAAMESLRSEGVPFDEKILRGAMIEIPSAALTADQFAREVDFFSIGTNDLVQYTMAADRGNDQVSYLYQPTNPAVLKLIDLTMRAAAAEKIPVAVCGETASDPVLGALWIGLGATELSMSASYIPVLGKVLRALTRDDLCGLADEVRALCADKSAAEIYAYCRAFLIRKIPDLVKIQSFFTVG